MLAACAVLAACAHYDWRKAGVGESEKSRDFVSCQQDARLSALRMANAGTRTTPFPARGPTGEGTTILMPSPVPERDPVLEQEYLSKCMRSKGYELVRQESG